jgi:hypothetical protein
MHAIMNRATITSINNYLIYKRQKKYTKIFFGKIVAVSIGTSLPGYICPPENSDKKILL